MNLLCIDSPKECIYPDGRPAPVSGPDLEIGSEYTCYDKYEFDDGTYYFLRGFPVDMVFSSRLFATLPDNTADEMAEEEQFIYDQFSC